MRHYLTRMGARGLPVALRHHGQKLEFLQATLISLRRILKADTLASAKLRIAKGRSQKRAEAQPL